MVQMFYDAIIANPQTRTLAGTPANIRPQVHAMLLANGYDDFGKIIPVPVTPLAPSVTNDDVLNTVIGMTIGMEYKLDEAEYIAYLDTTFNALDFSGNHTLLVRVSAEGINPVGLDTTLIFTVNLITPVEPLVSADDVNNVIVGIDETMEYKLDGSTIYTPYNPTIIPDFSGEHTVDVRVTAIANVRNASLPVTLIFTTNLITPDAPNVTSDNENNVIVGIDETMEYAVDGATSYTLYNPQYRPDLLANHTINVRVAAVEKINYASPDTSLKFTTV
ncbi:DUF4073 domain-containing protein [Clostridium estertheticum]|uniref:DUF4073 domain-containing protein n=1 Tax=Clostridium estertheticum TaxID=238834 RepID=UPI001C7DD0E6|nr:DUF4073 domain-containing protein [Clostridium estertheticum]MBX4266525.1 DUF4073 domain-containing protein [Clostridium estertheticum]WLC88135.1 DUF4073 domain-containing protein [Clostridium estertheticum]